MDWKPAKHGMFAFSRAHGGTYSLQALKDLLSLFVRIKAAILVENVEIDTTKADYCNFSPKCRYLT